jgi:23S rRNA (cytosine1962-C5)-methyltransferase
VKPIARAQRSAPSVEAATAFENRLAKNARHFGRWARRHGYGAYRVYDRDVPEFPFAIDCYVAEDAALATRVHLQEIDTGWKQHADDRARSLADVRARAARALGVAPEAVVAKRRPKRSPGEQHARTGVAGRRFVVGEGGLRFEVNLEAYVDTGLFADHRALRALVRERARGRSLLNVFAYTGSFTVYAAAGGAIASDTVDLSNTYLGWAARNFALNGVDSRAHALIRADALAWLARARAERRRYGLIVADVPAFSNSTAMVRDFDVQRDHAALIDALRALVAPGGELFFSTNLRSFSLDASLARDRSIEDITARVRAPDYRDPRVHVAFRIAA